MEVRDNKIIIEINVTDETNTPTEEAQPKSKDKNDASSTLKQGASVASGLPVVGSTVSKFTSVAGNVQSFGTAIAAGGATATLSIAGLVVAALAFAHTTAKEYVQNRRQSEELQRRAGYRRKQ